MKIWFLAGIFLNPIYILCSLYELEAQHGATNDEDNHEHCDILLALLVDLRSVFNDVSVTKIDGEKWKREQDHN